MHAEILTKSQMLVDRDAVDTTATHIHKHRRAHTHAHTHTHIDTQEYMWKCFVDRDHAGCRSTYQYICMRTCTHKDTHTHTHTHRYYAYIHIYTCVYIIDICII